MGGIKEIFLKFGAKEKNGFKVINKKGSGMGEGEI